MFTILFFVMVLALVALLGSLLFSVSSLFSSKDEFRNYVEPEFDNKTVGPPPVNTNSWTDRI